MGLDRLVVALVLGTALAPLWELCAREALYPMAALTAVATDAIAIARHGWFANASDLHGSARWATTRDLRAARLIDREAWVPQRLRRIADARQF